MDGRDKPGHDEKCARDIGAKQSFVASPGHDGEDGLALDYAALIHPTKFCDTRPYQNATRLPLPLAAEVDALAERGGWGKLSSSLPGATPPPRPPPQAQGNRIWI